MSDKVNPKWKRTIIPASLAVPKNPLTKAERKAFRVAALAEKKRGKDTKKLSSQFEMMFKKYRERVRRDPEVTRRNAKAWEKRADAVIAKWREYAQSATGGLGVAYDTDARESRTEVMAVTFGGKKSKKHPWGEVKIERVPDLGLLANGVRPVIGAAFVYNVVRVFKWGGDDVVLRLGVPLACADGSQATVPVDELARRALRASEAAVKAAAEAFGPVPVAKRKAKRAK